MIPPGRERAEHPALDENVATLFEGLADGLGDAAAITTERSQRTWRELDARAAALAGHLEAAGVGAGDAVAIALPNCIEYIEAFYAASKLSAVPVNVNHRYQTEELRYLFSDCTPAAVIAAGGLTTRILNASDGRWSPAAVVRVGADDSATSSSSVGFAEALRSAPAPRRVRSGRDGMLLYTGGTTGHPKGVVWPYRTILRLWTRTLEQESGQAPRDKAELVSMAARLARSATRTIALPASPLKHATGFHTAMGTLLAGGMVVLSTAPSLDPNGIWRLVGQHRVTRLAIVGDAFGRPLLEALDAAGERGEPYDLTSLKVITSSGTTWSIGVRAGLLKHGDLVLRDAVASSEGGPYAVAESRRGAIAETGHFRLAPGARLLTADGADVASGSDEIGVLAALLAVPEGYHGDGADSQRTRSTFRTIDGQRYSMPGDRAKLLPDGELLLVGRDSSVINTGGEKVFAEEIEQVLASRVDVMDVAVVGLHDDRWGQRVAALVVRAAGSSVGAEELSAYVGERLARYKRPREVVFASALKRSATGKLDRGWAGDFVADRVNNAAFASRDPDRTAR